jgi:hypothetical protein
VADNTPIPAVVSSGEFSASDDIAGVKVPRVKLMLGADGVNDGDASAVNPVPTRTSPGTGVNRSGTIIAGGTAQSLMSASSTRRGVVIRNNSAGSLWVNEIGGTAIIGQPSMEVTAGEYWETPIHYDCRQAWSIIGATTGQAFTCREF